jgi:O-antigen ligase
MRWLAAGVCAWLFSDAAWSVPAQAGVGTFGDPPLQAALWVAAGLGWLIACIAAPDRLALARRLGLALILTTLLGLHGVPADAGLRLLLLGVTLLVSAPHLRATPAAWVAAAALVLAAPGLLGAVFPHGALLWLAFTLPALALAWIVPALYPGELTTRPALLVLLATASYALLSLWSYVELSDGLDLPLAAVTGTRLRVMGLHPNLAVPHLVTAAVLGAALACCAAGRARWTLLLALAPVLFGLCAVRSRTGFAAAAFGLALLWISSRRGRLARAAPGLAAVLVTGMLVFPATGLSDASIGAHTSSMVDKSVSFRSAMWALGRRTVAAAPWQGNGPGTTYLQAEQALPGPLDGYPKDDHPHSVVLSVAEGLGWPGLLALALLFAAGLRAPRRDDRLGAACRAALLALFAANALDLGGAQNTLYPTLAFLLLGLAEARRATLATDPAHAGATARTAARPVVRPAGRRVAGAAALACAALGIVLWTGSAAAQRAAAALDRAADEDTPRGPRAGALVEARADISRADRFLPLSPEVPLLEARLAALEQDGDAERAALERALGRLPRSAALAHRLAVARSRADIADPRIDALLDDALRWDPYGVDAWRLHLDRARMALMRRRPEEARAALVTALLLNPSAAADGATIGREADLVLHPAGADQPGVPMREVLADLAAQRDALHDDPATSLRMAMRLVEIPLAAGAHDLAQHNVETLLAGEELYLPLRLARIQIARGEHVAALPALQSAAALGYFWTQVDLVDALSRTQDTASEAFQAACDEAILRMRAGGADCVFDLPSVTRLIEARLRWHERRGDALGAVRAAEALAFARR